MTGSVDPMILDRISAYLDGALPEAEQRELEALVASDPALAAEFEALSRVDAALATGFADMLASPVPLHLARAIEAAPVEASRPEPRTGNVTWFRSLAASVALLAVGAAGGAVLTRSLAPVEVAQAAPGWLDHVAEYHAVYAAQGRHLVEVPASEREHLETWLSEQTGVPFKTPDLSASGLTFEGGRLLVANGKPVAQLMYRDAAGQVVAVCFMAGGDAALAEGELAFADRRVGAFDLVSWKDREASYVVIGPAERPDLRQIAEATATLL
ncbi:anti-sigma factor family protein [Tabrizicola sp.]|uniref:anti-sigma factor family protein n=1 Tax=Tabrizicola sp. TaxID=2005166 RepID=UPI003F417FD7